MVKRLVDLVLAVAALVVLSPLFAVAAVGIRLCSRGPILFRPKRAGIKGRPFTLYKFRTMHADAPPRDSKQHSRITAGDDPRVFSFGRWLRRLKIDELPQLINIIRGDMAIVGPRPEDPHIVENYYTPQHWETLAVRPGLASPGSIYNYTHGERMLAAANTEDCYVRELLPIKLALDLVYVRRASLFYDARIVARTFWVIVAVACGKRRFAEPAEMNEAMAIVGQHSDVAI